MYQHTESKKPPRTEWAILSGITPDPFWKIFLSQLGHRDRNWNMGKIVRFRANVSSHVFSELEQYCERKKVMRWRVLDRALKAYLRPRREKGIAREDSITPSDVVELERNRGFASSVQKQVSSYNLPPVETPTLDKPIISSRRVSKTKSIQCHANAIISSILT